MKERRTPRRDSELQELRVRLAEAEETLNAIRQGEIDALVLNVKQGDQIFTLQGAERPYRLLIESINEGALTILQDGTILYCNSRLGKMLSTPIQKLIGASFYSFLGPEEQDPLRRMVANITTGGSKGEFLMRAGGPKAEAVPVQLSLASLEMDNVKAIGIIATDLTERRRQEEILRHLNEALEQRVRERTEEVTEANQALEAAQGRLREYAQDLEKQVAERTVALQQSVKSLEQFCYTIAHDLRAPLRTMSGFTSTLLEDFADNLPAKGQEFARRIALGAERMDQLIRDLLAYGRLNSADLPLNSTDPEPLLKELIAGIENKQATVVFDSPLPKVLGHPVALTQIFSNLLNNALKFVAPDVRPEIHIFARENNEQHARICFRDNGIGIDPKFHQRIFRVFERLSGAYPGTGIGLAIVQKGAERLGGTVGVESELGRGSCFWVELKKA